MKHQRNFTFRIVQLALLIAMGLAAANTGVGLAASTGEDLCNLFVGSVWIGSTPDAPGDNCLLDVAGCPVDMLAVFNYPGGGVSLTNTSTCAYPPGYVPPVVGSSSPSPARNRGFRRDGVCKLISVDGAYLGGMITAAVKGSPSYLRLKADGKTYKLPLVPGSVTFNGDGTYSAQFYTLDPETGQALIPAGDYQALCFGTNGTAGGRVVIEIGY